VVNRLSVRFSRGNAKDLQTGLRPLWGGSFSFRRVGGFLHSFFYLCKFEIFTQKIKIFILQIINHWEIAQIAASGLAHSEETSQIPHYRSNKSFRNCPNRFQQFPKPSVKKPAQFQNVRKKPMFTNLKKWFEHIELPAKLLDYFLRSNKSNINQSACSFYLPVSMSRNDPAMQLKLLLTLSN